MLLMTLTYTYVYKVSEQKAHAYVKWARSMGVAIIANRSTVEAKIRFM